MPTYGLIGYPLTYSLSPAMHNAAFVTLDMESKYELWPTHPDGLTARAGSIIGNPAVGGFNVTVPHKQAIIATLNEISPAARAVGAVNTVIRRGWTAPSPRPGILYGENTDVYGFQRMLQEAGVPVTNQPVLVLGAGGAARAVVYALLQMNVGKVWVLNRTAEKVERLLQDLRAGERGGVLDPSRVRECQRPVGAELHSTQGRMQFCPYNRETRRTGEGVASYATLWQNMFCPYGGLEGFKVVINATSSQDPWTSFGIDPDQMWSRGKGWAIDLMYGNMLAGFLDNSRQHGWQTLSGEGMLLYQAAKAFELWTEREAPIEVMRSALLKALRG